MPRAFQILSHDTMLLTPETLERLRSIGFNPLLAGKLAALPDSGSGAPARVCAYHGDHALVHDGEASQLARVHPALARRAEKVQAKAMERAIRGHYRLKPGKK